MPLELYPIQLPTTREGCARTPLILLFDGSGLAFEYTGLLPLDRLVYGVSVAVPELHNEKRDGKGTNTTQREYEEYLAREFSTVTAYIDQLVLLIEEEVLDVQEDEDGDASDEDMGEVDIIDSGKKTSAPQMQNRIQSTTSLHIGGFSFGGFLAIELARRLIFQAIRPTGSDAPLRVNVRSVILFDTYNPSAPHFLASYKQAIHTGIFHTEPSFAKYPNDHPLMNFIAAHILHLTKLVIEWKIQPLAKETGLEELRIPRVHYLRALLKSIDEVADPEECTAYWTKAILPTLDLGRMKILENTDHMEIWKPGKVEEVTEWLKDVLDR